MSLYGLAPAAFAKSSTKGSFHIRPLRSDDRDAWNALWKGYLDFYKTKLPGSQYDLTFARFLDPTEPMFAYVAEQGGKALGLVHIILHRSGWMEGPSCYLQDLFVVPEARGLHIGRALIEHVYEVTKAAGGTRVHWLTHETNATARKLYDRIADSPGFIQYTKGL